MFSLAQHKYYVLYTVLTHWEYIETLGVGGIAPPTRNIGGKLPLSPTQLLSTVNVPTKKVGVMKYFAHSSAQTSKPPPPPPQI